MTWQYHDIEMRPGGGRKMMTKAFPNNSLDTVPANRSLIHLARDGHAKA